MYETTPQFSGNMPCSTIFGVFAEAPIPRMTSVGDKNSRTY